MKKFLTLVVALVLTIPMMAIGNNNGSTKANAIDFDWDKGVTHTGGTKWYRVDLAPLYEEDNPSLTLYLTNPSNVVGSSVDVSMQATVAGQSESKDYTIAARQYKTYTANASMLVRMKQKEIYLTLTANPKVGTQSTVKLSAKVFEAADLDETCKDARTLTWGTEATQAPMYSAWWKVSLKPIKDATDQDAQITITNTGAKTVTLKVGQSLDCPSSGMTKREYTLAPGEPVVTKVPRDMITNVQPDELYFGIENVESQISIKVEKVPQPPVPVIKGDTVATNLHVTDTIVPMPVGTTLYKISVADMNAQAKYEPEFTYRNMGSTPAKVSIKMAFNRPAFSTSDVEYDLGVGEEEIVVYKKNMLEGMDGVDSIYLLTTVTGDVNFYGRFKHVREGKACKTNIDFNWETGHSQEGRTTQWYAINVADARDNLKDIMIYVLNQGNASATVKASMAFSCPYIDLQEVTRTIAANGDTLKRRMGFSSYAMMSDTIWIGLETNQDIRFWADTVDAKKNAVVDSACVDAIDFNWKVGDTISANKPTWFRLDMAQVDSLAAKFPTVFVQNLSSTAAAKITAELSLECPDAIANQSRSLTIAANDAYSKQISRNMFENIVQDEIYLRIVSTEKISLQIRLSEEAEGASCASAIPFNWVSGNSQKANDNLWYMVDLRDALKDTTDVLFKVENKENAEGEFIWKITKTCSETAVPSIERYQIGKKEVKEFLKQYASLKDLKDSVIYIGLEGTTALRFYAERTAVAPIDTINADDVTISKINIDNGVAVTPADSVEWYQLKDEDIQLVRKKRVTNPQTLAMHFTNTSAEATEVVLEIAYAFPVTEAMLQLRYTVPAGSTLDKTLNWADFNEKLADNDSIYIRVTIPSKAVGKFSVMTELVDAFDGASREEAVPLVIGKRYEQPAMTERWYKVNTADLKLDKDMYNQVLYVATKNIGTSNATINAAVYEGLLSKEDMLYGYMDAESGRSRTVKPGQGKSHNIPAQALYALGDVELYIWVRSTGKVMFETKFNGTYAKLSDEQIAKNKVDQENATLVVPNVDYYLPANETKWFRVCGPYILNNFEYTDDANLEYELEGEGSATVTVTATLQDVMTYDMPVRTRTLNKSGKARKGSHTLLYLMDRGIKHFAEDYGVPTLPEHDIDSLLRKIIASPEDSLTGYLRVSCTKAVHLRLNMKQTTGDACDHAMMFDWQHGNVNPAGETTWYQVNLNPAAIPESCDIRLHVDNWDTKDSSKVNAKLYFQCNDLMPLKNQNYTLEANGKESIDIDRDMLEHQLGWPAYMLINFNSEKASYIWAELIPNVPREYDYKTIETYVCQDSMYLDTITGLKKGPIVSTITWKDTVSWQSGVTMRDSVTTFIIHPLLKAEALTVDSMDKLGAAPLLVQGMQLFVDSSNTKLTEYYRNLGNTVDTIAEIDTVYWAKPVYVAGVLDNTQEAPLDLTSFYKKTDATDALLLVIRGGDCGYVYRKDVVFSLEEYKYATKDDTICPPSGSFANPDTMSYTTPVIDILGLPRYVDTIVTYHVRVAPTLYTPTEMQAMPLPTVANDAAIDTTGTIGPLMDKFAEDASDTTMAVTSIKWKVYVDNDGWVEMPRTVSHTATKVSMRYEITTECGTSMTSGNIDFELDPPCDNDTIFDPAYPTGLTTACDSFYWALKDTTIKTSGIYYYEGGLVDPNKTCHHYYELNVTILNSTDSTLAPVTACDSYYWDLLDSTITVSGTYTYETTNVAGCDSVVTLNVTINYSNAGEEYVTACDSYTWNGNTYTTSGDYQATLTNAAGCDSVATLHLTVNYSTSSTETPVEVCNEYYWANADTTIKETGVYTHVFKTVLGCDSVVTLNATIHKSDTTTKPTPTETVCIRYYWSEADTMIITSGTYTHIFQNQYGCDSVVTFTVDITTPYETTLSIKSYYGDRIIMIDRKEINAIPGWHLDSLDIDHPEYVTWYQIDLNGDTTKVGEGYYYTLPNGEPLPSGYTYYAVVNIPVSAAVACGAQGTTMNYTVPAHAAAPALVPSLARPGEDIQVINLDPEVETIIRIYTAEGLLQKTYTSYGQTTFTIKAASDNGFYLVELSADSMKSTLRYIVK